VALWSAHYYTHPNSYYPVEHSATAVGERLSRNDESEMRVWAKQYDKCVRQRSVRQDNTKDRTGTLLLALYETQTLLNPLDLQFVLPRAQSSVPGKVQNVQKVSLRNSLRRFSPVLINVTSTASAKVETVRRQRLLTRRMRDFL